MNLFYSEHITNNAIILTDEESIHCTKVLRKSVGNTIHVIDGKGNLFLAKIEEISKKQCVCSIVETQNNFGQHSHHVRMCIAPTKNIDRFEFFVEKAVEIGINEIIPILCENSERKILKLERIERIVISAMKQSYKAQKPIIHELTDIKSILKTQFDGIKCIAHCEENEEKKLLQTVAQKNHQHTILIGPEGDFSKSEIELALKNNWTAISLGNSRLRTETAGIVAVHTISLINE